MQPDDFYFAPNESQEDQSVSEQSRLPEALRLHFPRSENP